MKLCLIGVIKRYHLISVNGKSSGRGGQC